MEKVQSRKNHPLSKTAKTRYTWGTKQWNGRKYKTYQTKGKYQKLNVKKTNTEIQTVEKD